MIVAFEYQLRYRPKYQLRYRLRDQLGLGGIAGFPLGCAGLRGFAFFDISICTGNCL
jgi:hypothetical protein